MILTGSMGFGNITEMINKMQNEIKNVNFIVSCGHNEEVYNILKERCKNTNNIIKAKIIFFICKLLMGCVVESLFAMGFDIVFY